MSGAIERVLSQANRKKVDTLMAQAPSRYQEYSQHIERDERTGRHLWTLRDQTGALAGAGEAWSRGRAMREMQEAQALHYARLVSVRESLVEQANMYVR